MHKLEFSCLPHHLLNDLRISYVLRLFFFFQCYTLLGWPPPTNNSQLSLMHVWSTTYSLNGDTTYAMFSRGSTLLSMMLFTMLFLPLPRMLLSPFLSCLILIMPFWFLSTLVCGAHPCNLFVHTIAIGFAHFEVPTL